MVKTTNSSRFNLGQIVATPGAIDAITRSGDSPMDLLRRHQSGDWGTVCDSDKRLNDAATAHEGDLNRQERVLSAYSLKDGVKVWIITEFDRSVTTILLPSEY